jgi:hypothetical protein
MEVSILEYIKSFFKKLEITHKQKLKQELLEVNKSISKTIY